MSPEDIYLTDVSTCNSFSGLLDDFDHSDEAHVPDFLSNERVEGRMQQRFELVCRNRQEAITLHRAHGHPNNRTLLLNLEAKGSPHNHLKRYILAVSCHLPPKWSIPKKKMAPRASVEGNPRSGAKLLNV